VPTQKGSKQGINHLNDLAQYHKSMFKNNAITGNSKALQLINFELVVGCITYCIFYKDECSRAKFYFKMKMYVKSTRGTGERCKLPQRNLGQSPGSQSIFRLYLAQNLFVDHI